jgi:hypothetical protein
LRGLSYNVFAFFIALRRPSLGLGPCAVGVAWGFLDESLAGDLERSALGEAFSLPTELLVMDATRAAN